MMIGYLSEGNENTDSKRYLHPHVHAALFTISKIWKPPKCLPTDEWLNVVYILCNRILLQPQK